MVNAALLLLSGSLRSLCHFIFAPGLLYIPYALVRGRDLELNVYKYHQDTSLSLESEQGYYSILKCSEIRARSQMPAPLTAPQKAHGCAQHKGTQLAVQLPPAHTQHTRPQPCRSSACCWPIHLPRVPGWPQLRLGTQQRAVLNKSQEEMSWAAALGSCSCDVRTSQLAFYHAGAFSKEGNPDRKRAFWEKKQRHLLAHCSSAVCLVCQGKKWQLSVSSSSRPWLQPQCFCQVCWQCLRAGGYISVFIRNKARI